MRNGRGKIDVTKTLATNLGLNHFDAALFAHHAAMTETLVLAADTFVILYRTENLGAEKSISFRLQRTIVNRLWLGDFAERPAADLFRAGERNLERVELDRILRLLKETKKVVQGSLVL